MKFNLSNRITEKTFKIIDSKEKAYYLGFLWADGTITKTDVSLEILESDGALLLNSFKKIGHFNTYSRQRSNSKNKQINIRLYCTALATFLKQGLGYDKKSIDAPVKVLNHIPNKFHKYFWRGYFDGDGCISKIKGSLNRYRIFIYSSYDQDWSSLQNIGESSGFNFKVFRKVRPKGHKFSFMCLSSVENITNFCNYIYGKDYDGLGLQRKFQKYSDFVSFDR